MASIRDTIAEALVAGIDALEGFTCERRDVVLSLVFEGAFCCVNIIGETKRPIDELFYECDLRLGVTIVANREDYDPALDGGLEVRYLDRLVATVERAVASIEWPDVAARPVILGHDTTAPSEPNQLVARLEVQVPYRHNWNDPDTYAPEFP